MRRVFTLIFLLICVHSVKSYGLNVKITFGGTYAMDAYWESIATGLGHTASIVPINTLDDTAFIAGTDILIVSFGMTGALTSTQIDNIQRFVQRGKSAYVQAEYQTTFPGNVAAAQIVNNLGGTFNWTATVAGDLKSEVIGSLGYKNDTLVNLPYYWYGTTGTHSCNVMAFLVANSGQPVGWMFRPPTASYGRLIFTTDQDWILTSPSYPDAQKLMKNIIRHLADTAFGDKEPTLRAKITASKTTICAGTSVTFSISTINAGVTPSYQWKKNGSNVATGSTYTSTTLANNDTITCFVTASTECHATGTSNKIGMKVNALPTPPTTTTTLNICKDATPTILTASGSSATDTLKWYDIPIGGTPSLTAPTPPTGTVGATSYYVTQTNTNGCESPRTTITVNIRPFPGTPTVVSPAKFCQGSTATALTATTSSATDTLKWYAAASGGSPTATPVPSTATRGFGLTYYVSQRTRYGCEGGRDSIRIFIDSTPAAPAVTTPVTYCQTATATALVATTSTATDTLLWYSASSGGTGSKTATVPSTASAGSTNYYVSQKNTVGCESNRSTIAVNINAYAATPTVTTPVTYCQSATATALTATKGASSDTLLWYSASSGGTGSTIAPTPSTGSAGSITYYVGAKTSGATGGCIGNRTGITVNVNPAGVAPTVTTPVTYCQGATAVALTASKAAADTLLWYTVASGGTGTRTAPVPSTGTAGTTPYYVSAKTALGCEGNRTTLNVVINAKAANPTVTATFNYCIGITPAILTATPGTSTDTLLWYTVASGGTPSLTAPTPPGTPVGSTSWYVSGKTNLGCEGSRSTITVNIRPLATTPTVTTPIAYCRYINSSALTAIPGSASDTLLWYTAASGGTGNRTAPKPPTSTPGSTTWYVSGKTSFGCEGSRTSLTVVVNPLPVVDVISTAPTGVIVCRGGAPVNLKSIAATATGYQWYYKDTLQAGATTDSIKAGKTGYWYSLVTDAKGCKDKDSLWIQIDTSIAPVVTPVNSMICEGNAAYLTCHPGIVGHVFKWNHNGVLIDTIPTTEHIVSVKAKGIYTVVVTNKAGCTYTTDTATVDYYPAPIKPIITNTFPLLKIGGSYIGYQWYRSGTHIKGANGKNYTVLSDGKYYVEVTDANGCKVNSDTVEIQGMGIQEDPSLAADIHLYPNPSQGKVMIESPVAVQVMVTDINGRVLLQQDKAKEVNLASFADGLYLFYIRDEQGNMLRVERVNKSSVQY